MVTSLTAIGHRFRPDGTFDPARDYRALVRRLERMDNRPSHEEVGQQRLDAVVAQAPEYIRNT